MRNVKEKISGERKKSSDFAEKRKKRGGMTEKNCFVRALSAEQMASLKAILQEEGWEITGAPYCCFKAKKNKTTIAAYCSGKLVAQGRSADDFIEFLLEPRVTGCSGEPQTTTSPAPPEQFSPHAGIDESGKGDFFGPLVVACVFVPDQDAAEKLVALGVRDSKEIKNDAVIARLASSLLRVVNGKAGIVAIGPEAYNRIYSSFGSLNRLLAWGHARALENLLGKAPECTAVLADKFGNENLIKRALMDAGKKVALTQRTKAESDVAVAAASILARAEFVRRLNLLGKTIGLTLPKGAGVPVDEAAARLAEKGGEPLLSQVAKMHFRTAVRALAHCRR